MFLIGLLSTMGGAIFYSLRYSFVKDLGKHTVSKIQTNLFYRIVSFPIVALVVFLLRENLVPVKTEFAFWFLIALLINVVYGYFTVHVFQKHKFSSVESVGFLNILFSTLFGLIIFSIISAGLFSSLS